MVRQRIWWLIVEGDLGFFLDCESRIRDFYFCTFGNSCLRICILLVMCFVLFICIFFFFFLGLVLVCWVYWIMNFYFLFFLPL
jgi:hypothetical protein